MIGSPALELTAIALVLCLAVVPLWYPRYSFFHRNALAGIDHLHDGLRVREDTDSDAETRVATLEEGDPGFAELVHTIRAQTHVTTHPVRIELVHTQPDPEFETLVVGSGGVSTDEQAILLVADERGETEQVVDSPDLGVDRVLELVDLRQWVTTQGHRRSHYATTVLALLWGSVSILIVL